MTEQGILKLKSAFARDIFRQDLLQIYSKQTVYRDDIERSDNINQDIEKKLQEKIQEKKIAQGQKISY